MTEQLYAPTPICATARRGCSAVNERGGIVLDRTVFYASAGGQPGDKGMLEIEGGGTCPIATTVYDADKTTIVHVAAEGAPLPAAGQAVRAVLDWDTRTKLMRMHTCLHLLCALVKFPVTGGQIGADEGRLDFDIEDASAVDKDTLTADAQRADRRRSPGHRALDHRRRAGGQSRPRAHHGRQAADGHRAGCASSPSARTAPWTCSPAAARTCGARARSAASPSPRSRTRAS